MSAGQGVLTGTLTDPGLRSLRWTMWTGLMLLVLVSAIPEVWNAVVHPVAVVALIVVWAATWWRPLDADAAGAMVFLIGGLQVVLLDGALMADVIVLFALFRLGEQGRRRLQPVWLLLLVAGCTAAAVSWTQDERGEQTYWQSLVMLLLLTSTMGLLAWAGGRMIGQGRNIVRARAGEEKARRAEREQRRQAEAAALRTEIAGEVHDVVGHALALIAVQAEAARHLATVDAGETDLSDEQRLAQVGGAVETVLVTARGALAETRELTRSLAAPDDASSTSAALLHPTPGLADLSALVRSAADAGALAATTVVQSPAAEADSQLLDELLESGESVEGLQTSVSQVVEVGLPDDAAGLWPSARAVRVTLSQSASTRSGPSGRRTVPAPSPRQVVLVLVPEPWRVADIRAVS